MLNCWGVKMNKEKLIELKLLSEELDKVSDQVNNKQEEFETENKDLLLKIIDLGNKIYECKEVLKEIALVGFEKDGEKKRLGGIGIRVSKYLDYNNAKAFDWAKEKDLCLQLDKKQFEGFAKSGNLDFVEMKNKVIVTFPKEIKVEE